MRVGASFLLLISVTSVLRAEPAPRGVFWSAGGGPVEEPGLRGFTDAIEALGGKVSMLPHEELTTAAPLGEALEHARADYRRFQFAAALAKLDELARTIETTGGADLDAAQLSDIFFYRYLSRAELTKEGSWDDLVQAARLAPTRVLDTAQVAPRAVAAWRRALSEVSTQARVALSIVVPPDAHLRIDGAEFAPGEIAAGHHFVRVWAPGYEPWSGTLEAAPPSTRFQPALRPIRPPDVEALPHQPQERVVLGTLEPGPRAGGPWRFTAKLVHDGRIESESVELHDDMDPRMAVAALTKRVASPPVVTIAAPKKRFDYRKLSIGLGVGGGLVVVAGVAIVLGVIYGGKPAPGTASADLNFK